MTIETVAQRRLMKPRADQIAGRRRQAFRSIPADVEIGIRMLAPAWRRRSAIRRSIRRATQAALKHVESGLVGGRSGPVELTIVLADDSELRRLNREYRGIDKPTNVLAFGGSLTGRDGVPAAPILLGDVVLAYETIAREASAQGKSLIDHTNHLVIHGILHLLGHDHQTSRDARAMEAIETDVLAGLGIEDPYRIRRIRPTAGLKRRSRR